MNNEWAKVLSCYTYWPDSFLLTFSVLWNNRFQFGKRHPAILHENDVTELQTPEITGSSLPRLWATQTSGQCTTPESLCQKAALARVSAPGTQRLIQTATDKIICGACVMFTWARHWLCRAVTSLRPTLPDKPDHTTRDELTFHWLGSHFSVLKFLCLYVTSLQTETNINNIHSLSE